MARSILQPLFSSPPRSTDHRWYCNLHRGASANASRIRRFCEQAFETFGPMLDNNFSSEFRSDTPRRVSELFFASAFVKAGWQLIRPVTRFDLAFRKPETGRLLVEVTTPAPQPNDTWKEEVDGDHVVTSADQNSIDAALLRLTSALDAKSETTRDALKKGFADQKDYKVVAISGLRISQETPIRLGTSGNPPDFAKAFLPIGQLHVPYKLNPTTGVVEFGEFQHRFSSHLEKNGLPIVKRDAFVSNRFSHIDAIAYSEFALDELDNLHHQVGVLHNPTSNVPTAPLMLGMGNEYVGEIDGDQLHLRRERLPEVAMREDEMLAAEQKAFDELFSRKS